MACSSGDEDPDALTEIGHARLDEFGETGDERVLAAAVAAYERALEVLPPGEEQWTFLSSLGNALREVYEASRNRTALDRAGDLLERALHGLSSEDADRAVVLDNLALVLRDRYGDLGYLDELRKAAELHRDALAAYGDGTSTVHRSAPSRAQRPATDDTVVRIHERRTDDSEAILLAAHRPNRSHHRP